MRTSSSKPPAVSWLSGRPRRSDSAENSFFHGHDAVAVDLSLAIGLSFDLEEYERAFNVVRNRVGIQALLHL
jgi:hypothetical protein